MDCRSQQGITFLGFVMLLILFGFSAFSAMRVVPLYLDAAAIRTIMVGLEGKTFSDKSSLLKQLNKNLVLQNVTDITSNDFKITEIGAEKVRISADLQLTSPLFGNLSLLLKVTKQIEVNKSNKWQQN